MYDDLVFSGIINNVNVKSVVLSNNDNVFDICTEAAQQVVKERMEKVRFLKKESAICVTRYITYH